MVIIVLKLATISRRHKSLQMSLEITDLNYKMTNAFHNYFFSFANETSMNLAEWEDTGAKSETDILFFLFFFFDFFFYIYIYSVCV
jgi:hypothetical protein